MGFVPACFEVVLYIRKEAFQSGGFDGLKCLTVDPGRTTIPLGYTVGLLKGLLPCHMTKMPQKRCAFSDFAFRYIRRRSSCNAMGAFVISPLASLYKRSSSSVRALPSGAFCCTPINSTV